MWQRSCATPKVALALAAHAFPSAHIRGCNTTNAEVMNLIVQCRIPSIYSAGEFSLHESACRDVSNIKVSCDHARTTLSAKRAHSLSVSGTGTLLVAGDSFKLQFSQALYSFTTLFTLHRHHHGASISIRGCISGNKCFCTSDPNPPTAGRMAASARYRCNSGDRGCKAHHRHRSAAGVD